MLWVITYKYFLIPTQNLLVKSMETNTFFKNLGSESGPCLY